MDISKENLERLKSLNEDERKKELLDIIDNHYSEFGEEEYTWLKENFRSELQAIQEEEASEEA